MKGLTNSEAARRLALDGPNELPGHAPRGLARIAREVLVEPMFLLLLAAASIYMVLGDIREALALSASIVVVLSITILQERRTEHALVRLRDLSSPRALVIRDGREQRIAGRDVVAGDVVVLREGDRVPADGVLCSSTALSIDESILTGESLPVEKTAAQIDSEAPADASKVYSGSLIVRGYGTARITATGAQSEIGRIGKALKTLSAETTPLYREVRKIVRWVAIGALALCMLIAVLFALARNDWLGGALAGITVAMGVLPEEFPVVLTVFLAMGAWRISRTGVLTRRMPAIESIGAVTVLAVDKTGTMTENKMQVAILESESTIDPAIISAGLIAGSGTNPCCESSEKQGRTCVGVVLQSERQEGAADCRVNSVDLRRSNPSLNEATRSLLATALAASEIDAFDPMERAIHDAARRCLPNAEARRDPQSLLREYDLTPELLAVTHAWRSHDDGFVDVAVKGAPETVFDLCRLEPARRNALLERIALHARSGLRVLAVASGQHASDALPLSPHGFELRLQGFVCFADPLRSSVPGALSECHAAGIRVVMITGDHPGTALAIAAQAGFDTQAGVLSGDEIERLGDEELQVRVRNINLFARAKPEHKLRLVQALKANGEVVAMTGDGVNDAPALKAAHVGVAMGGRGTDVAREAAALVLVNDDFASLVNAVRLGRRIYANIRHAMSFIVAVHVPIAGLGLIPVLFGWPLIFFPMHVLFLEFVIDPACAFVFEADPESSDVMNRKPRRPDEPLFSRPMLRRSLSFGAVILALEVALYGIALSFTGEDRARTLAFIGLVSANLALIFVSRSRSDGLMTIYARPNKVYWWMVGLAMTALAIATYAAPVADMFDFSAPSVAVAILVIAIAALSVLMGGHVLRQRQDTQ